MKIKNDSLKFFNSYGGFSSNSKEYHIVNAKTPLPWCNIMSNKNFGTIVSSYGTVYSFFKNSREFKITSFENDWVNFTPGEKFTGIYEDVRDYNLIYGFGYTKVLEENNKINKEMTIFVPPEDNLKVMYINVENTSNMEEKINISYKLEPVLGVSKDLTCEYILCRQINDKMCFKNPYNKKFSDCISYVSVVTKSNVDDNDYTSLSGDLIDVCFDTDKYETNISFNLGSYKKANFAIILGATTNREEDIDAETQKFDSLEKIKKEYLNTKKYWEDLVVTNFKTPDTAIDIMSNGWLKYQTIVCRLYARSGFYQSGGAIGFRDQLQDSLALIRTHSKITRDQIILHSSKQFKKGDVLHWWHEHNNAGIRTYFSDDYLWLPYVLCEYINITNDTTILVEKTPYLEDKPMGQQRELYDVFLNTQEYDTVYEHAKAAILYSLSRINSKNGLLDIGDGDWNDGFSSIRGQSVWLTFFMMNILEKFINVAKIMQDDEMIKLCQKHRHSFKYNILAYAFDSTHFVRAFFENGEVLGSNKNEECKIDLISQTWAVIAMKDYIDVKEELRISMESVEKYLVDNENMIVKLLYPSFDKPKNNPGYIKAYVPGTRENGGQYTHAATWLAKAYFELKDIKNGVRILKYLNPIYHSDTKEKADKYMVEPYVIAADVYSNEEHIGRGGWTWYTGSAAWYYKIVEDYLS